MGVIESVKKGFSVAAKSMNVVSILFVFGLAWNLVNIFFFPDPQSTTPPSTQQTIVIVAAGLVFILLTIFMQGGSMGYVRDLVKQGSASLDSFKSSGGKYYLRLLAVGLIVGVIIGVVVLGAAVIVALVKDRSQVIAITGVIAALLLVSAGIYAILLMFFAPYIVVADEKKAIEAIKASVATVRNHILKVVGIFVVLVLIGFLVGVVIGALYALASVAIKGKAAQIIFAVLSSFVNAFLGLLVTGAFMHFYLAISNPNNNS